MFVREPVFLLDEAKCRKNIAKMAGKATSHGLILRPHFKTHQSAAIGEWFRQAGIEKIAVSSVKMAEYFIKHGWQDVTIAIPFNTRQAGRLIKLNQAARINIIALSDEIPASIGHSCEPALGVFIEIDNGYNRTGLLPEDTRAIEGIITKCRKNPAYRFMGFLTHAGNTYSARGYDEVKAIHDDALNKLFTLKQKYAGEAGVICSYGDTPSCILMENFDGIDEIRPGNFVFYDIMQENIGSCSMEDIAGVLVAPVLAKHPARNEIVVEGGAIHLSKDFIIDNYGRVNFGYPVLLEGLDWQMPDRESYIRSLSQEHGVIKASEKFFNAVSPGDVIGILPVHSCLAAHQMRAYYTREGNYIETMNS